MEQKEIYDLIARFEGSSLTVMEIQQEACRIHLEKDGGKTQPVQVQPQQIQMSQSQPQAAPNNYEKVKAPLVGVYYASSAPDEPPYVSLGDQVSKGQVLCLVEAMKMMNELKSPVDGIVRSIKGVSGELVEYDQILFEVEPC